MEYNLLTYPSRKQASKKDTGLHMSGRATHPDDNGLHQGTTTKPNRHIVGLHHERRDEGLTKGWSNITVLGSGLSSSSIKPSR